MPKPKLNVQDKRVILLGRVSPQTFKYLNSLGAANLGRAVDQVVDAYKAIMAAMKPEKRALFEPLPQLPIDKNPTSDVRRRRTVSS